MTNHRDAITGQYVTAEHAAANPDTTVREDDSRVRELQAGEVVTDWRECRVVRDRYGDLWGRRVDDPNWVQVGEDMHNAEPARELERDCGPLTPILDRDGLPMTTNSDDDLL